MIINERPLVSASLSVSGVCPCVYNQVARTDNSADAVDQLLIMGVLIRAIALKILSITSLSKQLDGSKMYRLSGKLCKRIVQLFSVKMKALPGPAVHPPHQLSQLITVKWSHKAP